MIVTLEYTPDVGIKINFLTINWITHLENVRKLLNIPFEEMDSVIDLGENQKVESKRDIYQNVNGGENYFFLNYNAENLLTEIEVHWGVTLYVKEVLLNFKNHIQDNVNTLKKLTDNYKEIELGNYLFSDLKLSISDSEYCGGDGHELRYFYASVDITHLDD
jgi:hypothetical protein